MDYMRFALYAIIHNTTDSPISPFPCSPLSVPPVISPPTAARAS